MTPDSPLSGSAQVAKPRTSIRQSLGLSSVGKALADVMNKEGRESERAQKKLKETRRLSAVNTKTTPRSSISGDSKPSQPKRESTPDLTTINRATRRESASHKPPTPSSDDPGTPLKSTNTPRTGINRSSSLRPRNNLSSAPKYRPRSIIVAGSDRKEPSPAGSRRRSTDDDGKEDTKSQTKDDTTEMFASSGKLIRPISPIHGRTTFKVNLTSINVPPDIPSKSKTLSPKSARPTTARDSPTGKSNPFTSNNSAIPRPHSSSGSSSSLNSHKTPKTPSIKNALGFGRSDKNTKDSTPLRSSTRGVPESPLAHHSRKGSCTPTAGSRRAAPGNMSHISEMNDEDSDEADVEMLLAPVASLAAPTPAMPRTKPVGNRKRLPPQTPTRASKLPPSRSEMSYLSPLPPDSESSPSLRPPRPTGDRARGSILSWEQLANEGSVRLEEGDIESMLTDIDIPTPFRTPNPGHVEIPESPSLNALPSPGGYGSISQVLLPDVTPSPANRSDKYDNLPPEVPAVDAAIVTLLRLQLASAEHTAKERLNQLQSLEEEVHLVKQARHREADGMSKQVAYLESQLRANMEARDRNEEERSTYTASLEDQLRSAQALRDQAVESAVAQAQEHARASRRAKMEKERRKWEASSVANSAASQWHAVQDVAESELDLLRANREMLSVLLAGLDQYRTSSILA